jgi:type VI protein secretion system component VasF
MIKWKVYGGNMEKTSEAIGIFVIALVTAVVLSLIFGWFVMLLWNWLMPLIFGLTTLTYWQSVGLSMLCSFLFKSSSTSATKK